MKIKDTLDLCGWELLNFCIQNHQNLEGLLDLGAGRKVFYTGNDQGKNGREVIYDGSKWKVSAYMSDVDELRGLITALESATDEEIEALKGRATTLEGRATTTEGNLSALKERVDAFLDGGVDSDAVLENLKEIQAFLDAYNGATSLAEILETKFDKAGGEIVGTTTISSNNNLPLILRRNQEGTTQVGAYFVHNGVQVGVLACNSTGDFLVKNSTLPSSSYNTLLHSGNYAAQIGDYYLKTDGSNVMGKDAYIAWSTSSEGNDVADWNTVTRQGLRIISSVSATSNAPDQYSTALHVKGRYGFQLAVKGGSLPSFHIRSAQSGVNTWREILHSGNFESLIGDTYLKTTGGVIEGNSAAFVVRRNANGASWVTFENRDSEGVAKRIGFLGMSSQDVPSFMNGAANRVVKLLHEDNYSDLITTLNGNLSVGGAVNVGSGGLRVRGNLNVPIEINGSNIKRYGRGGGYLLSDNYYGLTPTKLLVQVGVFANDDELKFYCIGNRIESSEEGERWFTINSASSAFYVPTSFSSGITTNELTIGGIRLSVENGLLKIEGSAFATGELAAGGAATEGNGGAGGFSLYESWGTSAPTEPLALGANLGWELKTRVEDLELAKTKVTFEPALVSGKPIGAITIDGNTTNLFAPATYAWSEIDGRPTNLSQFTDDVVTGNYLPLSGGTINGLSYNPLIIKSDDSSLIQVSLYADESLKGLLQYNINYGFGFSHYGIGGIYVNGDGKPTFVNNSSETFILLHSGNVGDYALKYTGTGSPDLSTMPSLNTFGLWQGVGPYIRFGTTDTYNITLRARQGVFQAQINKASVDDADWKIIAFTDQVLLLNGSNKMGEGKYINWEGSNLDAEDYESFGYGIRILTYDTASRNYRGGLSVGTRYGFQLTRLANGDLNSFTVRFNNPNDGNAWGDWRTLAFTDSDITGNAATATALKTAVNLWGNNFDGTQNLTKGIWMDIGNDYNFLSGSGSISAMTINSSLTNFLIGYGTTQYSRTINTFLDGYNIYFRTGAKQTAMTITEDGRVLINRSSAILDRQLSIGNGGVFVSATLSESPVLGSVGSNSLLVGASAYGMQHWVLSNGQGHIQVGRFDGIAAAYALNLNPLGGAVNIASANANTNVLGYLFASKSLYMSGSLMMNHGNEGIYMTGNSIHWHDKNDTYAAPLLSFASDSFTIYPTLYVKGLANFSSRVLVGAVTDDTESALQVSGKTKFFANDNAYKLYTRINGSSIQIGRTSSSYTGGYNGGLQVGEDNTSFGFIAGAYNEGIGSSSVLFHYGGSNNNNASIYIKGLGGNVGIKTANPSCTLDVNGDARVGGTSTFGGQSTFNALALFNKPIVAKDTLQIGDAILMWDGEKKALIVDKSFASMGEISAGGAGTEGGNTGGGGTGTIANPYVVNFTPSNETSHSFYHNLPYYDVVVQVYEKNAISGAWDMILADVTIANESNLVTVNFGRKEDVEHKIVVR